MSVILSAIGWGFLFIASVSVVMVSVGCVFQNTFEPGTQMHIYIGRRYNRTATIINVEVDGVAIYDNGFMLPVHYSGGFYKVGYLEDGETLYYIISRRRAIFMFVMEFYRTLGTNHKRVVRRHMGK